MAAPVQRVVRVPQVARQVSGYRASGDDGPESATGDDGCTGLRSNVSEGCLAPIPLASVRGLLFIESMFCPHDVSLIKCTIFVSVHLDISTGYEPGLNALPIRKLADIRTPRTCRFLLLASVHHPCTQDFKPQPSQPQRQASSFEIHLQARLNGNAQRSQLPLLEALS
jgi:hypothetical protein